MGLLSGLFGGATTTQKTVPWGPQADQLNNVFSQAQTLYNSKAGTPWYTGELTAPLDPLTLSGIGAVGDYATGAGADAAGQVAGVGSNLLGTSPEDFLASIGAFGSAASMDPTQANLSDATQYINNPLLQAQIDAIGGDISRNLSENTLPAIDRSAVGTGNMNSSRTGIAEGLAEQGAQQELGNEAAQIRANAYQSALQMAEQGREYNLGALGEIPGMYNAGTNTGLAAALQAHGMTLEDLNAMIQGGQINQQNQQDQLNAELERWLGNDTRNQSLLDQYYQIVGGNNWGGTTTQRTSGGGPGILGGLLGIGLTGASLFGTGGAFPGALKGLF